MYSASDLRKGLRIEINGDPYIITDFHFLKPGKGHAIYNCKLKNLVNGTTLTKSFRTNEKIDEPKLEERTMNYSYQDGDSYVFIDGNYEQLSISSRVLGYARFFLTEDLEVEVMIHNDQPMVVEMPAFVEKKIVETQPGIRGNTATNVLKPATVEGGYQLNVPLFINQGDIIKIDTRTGEYSDRVRMTRSA